MGAWARLSILAACLALAACAGPGAVPEGPSQQERPPFDLANAPEPPDYDNPAAWAALPWREDAADVVPTGSALPNRQDGVGVDVFFIYPTTDQRTDRWNAPLDDEVVNEWTDRSVITRQAGAFNAAGRVFAPRYRQGSSRTGDPGRKDGGPAFALAFDDVHEAFQHYLAHWNRGRPFILAGHSQGGFLGARLLEEIVRDPSLKEQLVAAYLIGSPITQADALERFPNVPTCASETQTGCLLAWNVFLDNADLTPIRQYIRSHAHTEAGRAPGSRAICAVPAFGKALGGLYAEPGSEDELRVVNYEAKLSCNGGELLISRDVLDALDIKPLTNGIMHFHDFGIFYEEIRADAARRAQAFVEKRKP